MARTGTFESVTGKIPGFEGTMSDVPSIALGSPPMGGELLCEIEPLIWLEARASTSESMSLEPVLEVRERNRIDDWLEERGDKDVLPSVDSSNGIRNENRLPSLTFESTRNCPPSCSTILATTAKPRPNENERRKNISRWHNRIASLRIDLPTPAGPDFGSESSTCSNSRNMISSLSAEIPHPVSATTISTAVCLESRRPSGSVNVAQCTVIMPWEVYLTDQLGSIRLFDMLRQNKLNVRELAIKFWTTVLIFRASPMTWVGASKIVLNSIFLRLASLSYRRAASLIASWRLNGSLNVVSLPHSSRVRSYTRIRDIIPRTEMYHTSRSFIVKRRLWEIVKYQNEALTEHNVRTFDAAWDFSRLSRVSGSNGPLSAISRQLRKKSQKERKNLIRLRILDYMVERCSNYVTEQDS